MKIIKTILIVLCFLSLEKGYCQSEIGSSFDDLRTQLTNAEYDVSTGFNQKLESKFILTMGKKDAKIVDFVNIYWFNKLDICERIVVHPGLEIFSKNLVEKYNKTFVVISPFEWCYYTKNGVLKCEYKFNNTAGTFEWSKLK